MNKNLSLYALKDEKTGVCSMFATSMSDEFALKFYIDSLTSILNGLKGSKKEKQRIDFMNCVHNSKLVRLADIDVSKPEIQQNLAYVADFADLVIDNKEKEKK